MILKIIAMFWILVYVLVFLISMISGQSMLELAPNINEYEYWYVICACFLVGSIDEYLQKRIQKMNEMTDKGVNDE